MQVIKEENALHPCDQCDKIYMKYQSLRIHKQRTHNSRLSTACPECGKLLSAPHALKKHKLSHM
jgi:RNase P subunit RPR2